MNDQTSFLTLPDRRLAYQQAQAPKNTSSENKLGVMFLGGFGSDMTGTKASFLAEKAGLAPLSFLRFDYRGHGQSSDRFENGTLGDWFDDALTVFDRLTEGPQILVGSSMGGWIALLLARARPDRVAGIVGVAAAPDFTEDMILPSLNASRRAQLEREGLTYDEDAPPDHRLPLTLRLIEEARGHLLLRAPLDIRAPVHLLQGQKDREVPWQHALKIAETLTRPMVRITLIKDGDHRLNRPQDLALMWSAIQGFF
ncbi:MAG: alpha/beta hydrolase [Alphaproteobacteria bacterium]|nr:alpha/beta hydrolase [Alphaproteobacteria bacterium]